MKTRTRAFENKTFLQNAVVEPRLPYTPQRVEEDLKKLEMRYPEYIRLLCCGKSECGRNIPFAALGRGHKKALAVAGIHGREYVTVGYLLRVMEEYACAARHNRLYGGFSPRKILQEYTIYLVPMANPDGVLIAQGKEKPAKAGFGNFRTYKDNARGVNLNANFPYEWCKVPKCRHRGALPKSERETKFLVSLCEKEDFDIMLSFHCRGGVLYWRDRGNGEIKGDMNVARRLGLICGYSLEKETERVEAYSGGFENWFRARYGRVGLCVELVPDENADFEACCADFFQQVDYERSRLTLLAALTA